MATAIGCERVNSKTALKGGMLCHHARWSIEVDGQTVELGSFNYTSSAESRNAENLLVLHQPAVAERYGQEWDRLWAESDEMKAKYRG